MLACTFGLARRSVGLQHIKQVFCSFLNVGVRKKLKEMVK